jgi:hypothetical protein
MRRRCEGQLPHQQAVQNKYHDGGDAGSESKRLTKDKKMPRLSRGFYLHVLNLK